MTFEDLKDLVLDRAFPGRMARNLIDSRVRSLKSGLVDIQTFLPGLREKNVTVFHGEDSYSCGAMVVQRPEGNIVEVTALRGDIPDGDDNHPTAQCQCAVQYLLRSVAFIRARASEYTNNGGEHVGKDGNYATMLPVANGFFGIERDSLWAYPATTEPWALQVRWDGIRWDYEDGDEVLAMTNTQVDLLIRWVQAKGAADTRCWADHRELMALYLTERRDECHRLTQQLRPAPTVTSERNRPSFPTFGCLPNCSFDYANPTPP